MSKILDAKNAMQDLSVRELRILQRWISDEISIKERNQELSRPRAGKLLAGKPAKAIESK